MAARSPEAAAAEARPFVLFAVDGARRLARLDDVSEIVPMMELQTVGGEGGGCVGMMNLRGEIVPVFAGGPTSPAQFIVLLRSPEGLVGLVVDVVDEVVEIPASQVTARPVGQGRAMPVARFEDAILPILEPADVVRHGV